MPEPSIASESTEKSSPTTSSADAPAVATGSPVARALPVAALAISVVALGLAGWAALRPSESAAAPGTSTAEVSVSATDSSAAKTKVCTAFDTARQGVSTNTNAAAPGGEADIAGNLAVAANARLSLFAGGQYLLGQIDPATPAELAEQAREFGNTLVSVGATTIAGVPTSDPALAENMQAAETLSAGISELCTQS